MYRFWRGIKEVIFGCNDLVLVIKEIKGSYFFGGIGILDFGYIFFWLINNLFVIIDILSVDYGLGMFIECKEIFFNIFLLESGCKCGLVFLCLVRYNDFLEKEFIVVRIFEFIFRNFMECIY